MNNSEVKRQVLDLAREGFLLPVCPECGIPMDLDTEALVGEILWIKRDFPKA